MRRLPTLDEALLRNQYRYMFHQANMRVSDVPTTTVNGKTGQFSLLMTWLEVVVTEMTRL